jgi:hypothetical protein
MEDPIKPKLQQMVSSLTAGNQEARTKALKSLSEEDTHKNPEEYLNDPKNMGDILKLVKNKKLSGTRIKQKIKEFLKNPEELREFLTSILEKINRRKENKESTGASSAGAYSGPLFSGEEPKKVEAKEATSSSSSGSYETPAAWAKSTSKKDWRGKSKTQIPGGKFVQVKKKCKKFPYCNQGDIKALKIFENDTIKKVISNLSEKMDIHEDFIKEIIYKEIVKRKNK